MVLEDMEYLHVFAGATSMSLNDRFTILADTTPFQRAAPLRARRMSTNDGPLLSSDLRAMSRNQDIVDEVVQQLGLDWRVQELQQNNHWRSGSRPPSRAGSRPPSRSGSRPPSRSGSRSPSQSGSRPNSRAGSRANSMPRLGSEGSMPGLIRANSWGNLSRDNSVGNYSQRSNYSGRSNNRNNGFHQMQRKPQLDLNQRLQMRNAWMRNRRVRGRGRGRGGYNNRGRMHQNQRNQRNTRGRQWGQWGQWNPRRQWGQFHSARQAQRGWGRVRRWGHTGNRPPLTPRGRAGQEFPQPAQSRGGGTGYNALPRGVSQNSMPPLKTLEQLDKELDEYMASAPDALDKDLEKYMAQHGLDMDIE